MQRRVHLYEIQAKNKFYSFALVVIVIALLVCVGYLIGEYFGYPLEITIGCLIFSILYCAGSYFAGAEAIMAAMGAQQITKRDYPQLYNVTEEMAIASGLPVPKIYVIPSSLPNAFATGRSPKRSAIGVTTELLDRLTRDELQGVVAHEISHIRHRDILFTMLIAVIVGAIIILCELFWRILWYSCWIGGRRHSRGGGGKGAGLMLLLALLAAIIAPILAQIIQFAASRKREYLADAGAAELTRNPNALANALEKISKHRNFYRRIEDTTKSRATQHLFIVNPLKPKGAALGFMGNLFSTHPPIQERVKILRQLAGQYVS